MRLGVTLPPSADDMQHEPSVPELLAHGAQAVCDYLGDHPEQRDRIQREMRIAYQQASAKQWAKIKK